MFAKVIMTMVLLAMSAVVIAGPTIEHWTLANGARVYFVPAREVPMVQLRAVFDAAAQRDPADKPGLANLTGLMLREGADGLTVDDVAERFEGWGADFSVGVDREMTTVSLRSLSDAALLDPAVALFARLVAAPSFPASSLERERARLRVALQKERQSASAVVQRAFMRALYGDHPYAHEPSGDETGLDAIVRDDLVAHHRRYYTGKNALLAVVGDLSEREARQLSERILGGLPAGDAAPPTPPVTPVEARQLIIPFPATQSHIRLGQPGVSRHDPDYFPLLVGNYTLGGGGLVSRLSVAVREQRGLSYSVYSYFYPMREHGPFMLGLQTRNDQRQEALAVVRQVLTEFAEHGPTEQELQAAKRNLTGSFPLRLDSGGKIADYLAAIGFYRLPLSYLDDFIPNVENVTIQQVRDAFRRRVQPDRLVTVIVGGKR